MQPLEIRYGGDLIAFLFPKGQVATQERDLLLIIQVLMLLVVIPVYFLTFLFSWVYRAHNKKAKHTPDWDHHHVAEYIWWGLPFILILIIGILTCVRTYQLDPFRALPSDKKPLTIQVVALQWKWLFIYPEENIATVNFVQFPVDTPLHFEITADAPMNSFWIPQLGGQIYAMPKMKTELYLMADALGDFRGSSANISGAGFSSMHFIARSSSEEDFHRWVVDLKNSPETLDLTEYQKLALPGTDVPISSYRLGKEKLFDWIIMKYMHPMVTHE